MRNLRVLSFLVFPTLLGAVPKMPLLEVFTNVGCPYCGPADDTLDALYAQFQGQIAIIRYHTYWPDAQDPYYRYNVAENYQRINFYGTNYTPRMIMNGTQDGQYLADQWRGMIQNALQETTFVSIAAFLDVDTAFGAVRVRSVVTHSGPDTLKANLIYALVEDSLYYMGSNGHPWHHQVMRDMIPLSNGAGISLAPGSTLEDTHYVALDTAWNLANLRLVVFLQNILTKEVFQTGFSEVLFVDVADGPAVPRRLHVEAIPGGIRISGPGVSGIRTVELYDALGRSVVPRLIHHGSDLVIRLSGASRGVYFFRIRTSWGSTRSGRFVIP